MKSEIDTEKNEALKNKIKWKERFICCPVCRETIEKKLLGELNRFYENYATNDQKNIINNKLINESIQDDLTKRVVISNRMRKIQNEVNNNFQLVIKIL